MQHGEGPAPLQFQRQSIPVITTLHSPDELLKPLSHTTPINSGCTIWLVYRK